LYFALFVRLRRSVGAERWQKGAAVMGSIRRVMLTNLILGVLITIIGVAGPFLG